MSRISVFSGSVEEFKAVTRNRVQLRLRGQKDTFELFLDQAWVLSRGDSVRLAGARDETGKVCCYAYHNEDRGVMGWCEEFKIPFLVQIAPLGVGAVAAAAGAPKLIAWIIMGFGLIWAVATGNQGSMNGVYRESKRALMGGITALR